MISGVIINKERLWNSIQSLIDAGEAASASQTLTRQQHIAMEIYLIRALPVLEDKKKFQILCGARDWPIGALSLRDFAPYKKSTAVSTMIKNAQAIIEAVFGSKYTSELLEPLFHVAEVPGVRGLSADYVIAQFDRGFRDFWEALRYKAEPGVTYSQGGWRPMWEDIQATIVVDKANEDLWEKQRAKKRMRTFVPKASSNPMESEDSSSSESSPPRSKLPRQPESSMAQGSDRGRDNKASRQTSQVGSSHRAARSKAVCIAHLAHELGVTVGDQIAPECRFGSECRFDHGWRSRSREQLREVVNAKKARMLQGDSSLKDPLLHVLSHGKF
jgi:hypothetical protein